MLVSFLQLLILLLVQLQRTRHEMFAQLDTVPPNWRLPLFALFLHRHWWWCWWPTSHWDTVISVTLRFPCSLARKRTRRRRRRRSWFPAQEIIVASASTGRWLTWSWSEELQMFRPRDYCLISVRAKSQIGGILDFLKKSYGSCCTRNWRRWRRRRACADWEDERQRQPISSSPLNPNPVCQLIYISDRDLFLNKDRRLPAQVLLVFFSPEGNRTEPAASVWPVGKWRGVKESSSSLRREMKLGITSWEAGGGIKRKVFTDRRAPSNWTRFLPSPCQLHTSSLLVCCSQRGGGSSLANRSTITQLVIYDLFVAFQRERLERDLLESL